MRHLSLLLLALLFHVTTSFCPKLHPPKYFGDCIPKTLTRQCERLRPENGASGNLLTNALNEENADSNELTRNYKDRRGFFRHVASATAASLTMTTTSLFHQSPPPANAMGLMQFPCTEPLHNRYYLMRAGQSLLEEQDIWSTNPLFLTNREAALSQEGQSQVLKAVRKLQEAGVQPSQIRHSLAASAMDTAGIVRDELKVGQNRINPEFVFMDPRAIGAWEGNSYQQTIPAVVALDNKEAGKNGQDGRPPPNDDGTPNETLFDQATRLRQLMSALETQYSGDSILLVFPDGTGPALLSAMMAGIPLNQVHLLDYRPGEIRMDVTMQSTLDLFQQRQKEQAVMEQYTTTLQQGEKELQRLRSMDSTDFVSKKDQMMEQEQLAIEKEYLRKAEASRKKEQEAEQARLKRQRDIQKAADAQRKKEQDTDQAKSILQQPSGKAIDGNTAVGGLAAGAVMVGLSVVAFGDNDSSHKETYTSREEKSLLVNETAVPTNSTKLQNSASTVVKVDTTGKTTTAETTPVQENELLSSTSGSSPQFTPVVQPPPLPIRTEKDKIDEARAAMEEYMNKDDGGDDWLSMLGDIIEEEEQIIIPEFGETSKETGETAAGSQKQEAPKDEPFQ